MTRLYLRIYLAFLAIVIAFAGVSGALIWLAEGSHPERQPLAPVAALMELALPPPGAPPEELQQRLQRIDAALGGGIAVFAADGRELAHAGPPVPPPRLLEHHHWIFQPPPPAAAALHLSDGRWVVGRPHAPRHAGHRGLWLVALFAGAAALGALPLARSITRRLERVSREVEAFGQGRLSARAPVEGRDEVARLARRFNRAAAQIEALVGSQRALLASASHELRSPLARLRLAVELFGAPECPPGRREELRQSLYRDVGELDAAIEELLAVSRLDLVDASASYTDVDLLGLAAEESARFARAGMDVEVEGPPGSAPAGLRGDARSLRHLLRNLLSNAERHAPGAPVRVSVTPRPGGGCILRVADAGPGIPPELREKVFEPFQRGAARPGTGAGLGLSLVRHIARHHGGDARALPREGGGSVIEVELPGRGA